MPEQVAGEIQLIALGLQVSAPTGDAGGGKFSFSLAAAGLADETVLEGELVLECFVSATVKTKVQFSTTSELGWRPFVPTQIFSALETVVLVIFTFWMSALALSALVMP